MVCVLAHPGFWIKEPQLEANWVKLVHAEQSFDLSAPLPPEGEVLGKFRITGVVDKGAQTGALMYFEKSLYTAAGAFLGNVNSTYFLRGDGGCGSCAELPPVPTDAPMGFVDVPTSPIAALIYRLSGDYNPLHADPAVARKAGFDKPILHGLCTFGIACHSLVRALCANESSRLRRLGARFTKPVFPGETIRTEYWTSADGSLRFRSLSLNRNEVVLDRGTATVVS
jgi:acyl dehydratase